MRPPKVGKQACRICGVILNPHLSMKKTVVIGASPNPSRYSHMAVQRLAEHNIEVVAVGLRNGEIDGIPIQINQPSLSGIHTVTLYVGPYNQPFWYDYIFSLTPKRLILNPGTENPELRKLAETHGIEVEEACTLVMLSTGQY